MHRRAVTSPLAVLETGGIKRLQEDVGQGPARALMQGTEQVQQRSNHPPRNAERASWSGQSTTAKQASYAA